jgi:hypothetical protein
LTVVKIVDKVQAISATAAGSAHTGRALKAAKVLNLIGTVRGAVTTVLLASSAIGGAVTVNNVRQDIADKPAATVAAAAPTARITPAPTPSPLTAAGLRSDADKRLQTQLAANAQAAEDLRKVTVLSLASIDALVLQTRQKLQARYELALSQIDELLKPPPSASPGTRETPRPTAGLSLVAVNALVQVALSDMSGMVFVATKTATTEPPPIQTVRQTLAPTPVPTAAPTIVHTAVPTPVRTASPSIRPSPTR